MINPLISAGDLAQAANGVVFVSRPGAWASQACMSHQIPEALAFWSLPENELADEYFVEEN